MILDFAGKHGKQHEMQEVLFRAYFAEGRNVSSNEVLKELVEEVGLDSDKALAALRDSEYVSGFEKGVKETHAKGIVLSPQHMLGCANSINSGSYYMYHYFIICRYHWSPIF